MQQGQRPTNAQIAALLGLNRAGPGPSLARPQISFPTPRFVPTGSLKPTPKSISGSIQATIARGLNAAGMNERRANRLASRTMAPLTDVTPVGNVTGAQDGGRQFMSGVSRGDLTAAGLGALAFGLSVAPLPGGVKRTGKKLGTGLFGSMVKDNSGAIRAWHGSPHDFDRFEWSPRTRGTGEGAQAYGDGLYFAEQRKVAEEYQRQLAGSHGAQYRLPSGEIIQPQYPDTTIALDDIAKGGDPAGWFDWTPAEMESKQGPAIRELLALKGKVSGGLERLPVKNNGRLYEVNINAEPEDFLDWDKTLEYQEPIRGTLSGIGGHHLRDAIGRDGTTGQRVYRALQDEYLSPGGNPKYVGLVAERNAEAEAAKRLRDMGIPGIRFLDQGSRGAGNGTSNFVVFDDSLIDILNKY